MATDTVAGGAPATLENTSRDILAGLGNDSPSSSQLTAVEAWITAEGSFANSSSAYFNNPLNVTKGNVQASINAGYLPSNFNYSIPNPSQNGGNPVLQFPDLTSGIIATIAALKQNFASPIAAILAKPGANVTTNQLSVLVTQSHWGTQPFGNITPDPNKSAGDGTDIGVTSTGNTSSGNAPAGNNGDCVPPGATAGVGEWMQYILCQAQKDIIAGAIKVGWLLLGIVLILAGIYLYAQKGDAKINVTLPTGKTTTASTKTASESSAA